jgi:hypothetical protein
MVVEDAPPLVEDLTQFGGCDVLLSLPLLLRCHQENKSGFIRNLIIQYQMLAGTERLEIRGIGVQLKEGCPLSKDGIYYF